LRIGNTSHPPRDETLIWINDVRYPFPVTDLSSGNFVRPCAAPLGRQSLLQGMILEFAMGTDAHIWYVAFRRPDDARVVYVRNSKTFRTEIEAKQFARERLEEGCDVSAGTINPHRPRRTIGPGQIMSWLEDEN